jgi:hypothetical protein
MTTKHLSNQALCSVALNGSAEAPGRGNSQTSDGKSGFQHEHHSEPPVDFEPTLVHTLEILVPAYMFVPPKARHKLLASEKLFAAHCKALAAFGASPLEHQAAVLRAHSNKKSVRLASMATIRLKCALALHRFLSIPQEARLEEFAPASPAIFE